MIKLKKSTYIILIFILVLVQTFGIYASTTSELKEKQTSVNNQINQTKSEISDVKNKMSTTMNQVNNLLAEVDTYQSEIDELEVKLEDLNKDIEEKQIVIKEKEDKYAENKEMLDKRLIAWYKTGNTTYLDVLLNAEGLTDFISKYYLISQLADYDVDLLNKIQTEKEELEAQKAELDNKKSEIEATKTTIESKRSAVKVIVNEKNSLVSSLSNEEKELEKQLEELKEDQRQINAELAQIAAKSGKYTTVAPSAAGYTSPLPGRTKANITTGYGKYSWGGNHTGVDFAVPGGTPIVAVKDGTVVISKALKNSNGSYRSYGEYIAIDHHDGTITLYGHGQAGSRLVSVGQSVTQGQQIMSVGSTGNSTGNHLHFEVRVGSKPVNPTPYLP